MFYACDELHQPGHPHILASTRFQRVPSPFTAIWALLSLLNDLMQSTHTRTLGNGRGTVNNCSILKPHTGYRLIS